MAEKDLYTTVKNNGNNNNNNVPTKATTKIYNHFLYKAVFLSILFLLVLPLFPWQANPDSEKTNTTSSSWELLQLVFVGIAVSYGVFSKLNDETSPKCEKEEEEGSSTHTYVSRLLQVSSSVFDDDDDDDLARGHGSHEKDSSKQVVQTWNSQYYRGEPPIVVVAKESSSNDHPPPLLLPVRSLKNKASESSSSSSSSIIYDDSKLLNNTSSSSKSLRRLSSSRSRSKSKLSGEAEEENTVLRSPIPWRSRSGKMMTGIESPLPNSSSNPLSSSQIQSQEEEHVGPKHKSPVPPPPPPPPPPPHNTRINTYYPRKELRRNIPKYEDLNNRGGNSSSSRRGAIRTHTSSGAKFFTTEYLSQDKEIQSFIERRGSKKQFFIDDDGDDDHDHEGKPQKFTDNPKEFFTETASKDSDDESEVEEHEEEEEEELQELASKKNVESIMDNVGPDVDKKADEFIAKFREQIRLQRIASIRTSTALLKPTKNVP